MRQHGESIYGTTRGEEYDWGVTTRKGDTIYLHVLEQSDTISLPIAKKPRSVSVPFRFDKREKKLTITNVKQFDVITIKS